VKQVIQRTRDGQIDVREVPAPALRPGWVLVSNRFSLISAGTERSRVQLGETSLVRKAITQPAKVKKVLDRARVEGIGNAVSAAMDQVDTLSALGYSSAGVVMRVGAGVEGIAPGDNVACGGAGWANHAEVIAVPRNLVAKVRGNVDLADGAYATVGAIALHAIRQADRGVGETVGVIGLGLVGQLATRLLSAAGCVPFGVDLDSAAVELARQGGALAMLRDNPGLSHAVAETTDGRGLDAVLICAAAPSSDPLELAGHLARDRGTLVVVGDVPIEIPRALLYEKELQLRISRSYGPGRYETDYEERGRDLPAGYVRWTEQRNLQAFVDLVGAGKVDPSPLTTHRFPVEQADQAYALLKDPQASPRPFGVLLEYHHDAREQPAEPSLAPRPRSAPTGAPRIGLIGAGSFARATLLPALRTGGARLTAVASETSLTAADVARRFDFERVAASADEVLAADDVDAVVIATRHGSHAELAAEGLRAGKAVFVEKPLALTEEELELVEAAAAGGVFMVGFNRRFAPFTEQMREALSGVCDRVLSARVNGGHLPAEHWLHDPVDGGGRLLGEGCHFVDLLAHLAGTAIVRVHAMAVAQPERGIEGSDSFVATLQLADGGVASLAYSGGGSALLPKERFEGFGGGTSVVLDDFTRLEIYRGGKPAVTKAPQDKGHKAEIALFLRAAAGEAEAPPAESYFASTRATLALAESLRTGAPVDLPG
jgi:predicted dehydrogenase/threonine dehydrogenase-like Zn-dependent dehydrogenase